MEDAEKDAVTLHIFITDSLTHSLTRSLRTLVETPRVGKMREETHLREVKTKMAMMIRRYA